MLSSAIKHNQINMPSIDCGTAIIYTVLYVFLLQIKLHDLHNDQTFNSQGIPIWHQIYTESDSLNVSQDVLGF